MLGLWFIKLSNVFVLPDLEAPIINIPYRGSGILVQSALSSFTISYNITKVDHFQQIFYITFLILQFFKN